MITLLDFVLSKIESWAGRLHSWAWRKRWCNRGTGIGYRSEKKYNAKKDVDKIIKHYEN